MVQEIKNQWVKALRSGRYEQGKRALSKNGKFCCLGVLCDLYAQSTEGIYNGAGWEVDDDEDVAAMMLGSGDYLPEEVRDWAGLGSNDPTTNTSSLSRLNDGGVSFQDIADIIEKEL